VEQLKTCVRTIFKILTDAEDFFLKKYPEILTEGHHPTACWRLPREIAFASSQQLHDMYPDLDVHG
jgi:asparagine synthetase A